MKYLYAIETFSLTKRYGKILALDSLDLKIAPGEVFGLLGPNGAGKTTAISMLCTVNSPTSGTALVNGFDIRRQAGKVRRSIGIVFQDPSIDDRLTGRENMMLHATLYDIGKQHARKRINELLDLVGLTERADSPMKTYSGGMRRRLELARGLLHSPGVLFLDEPTLGLDPQTREHLWSHIEELARQSDITVILTTHYMEEAERLCSRVGIIDSGRIKIVDTPANLIGALQGDVVTVITSKPADFLDRIKEINLNHQAEVVDSAVRLHLSEAEKNVPVIVELASAAGIELKSVSIHKPTLNDVFLHYTGKEIRTEEAENEMRKAMRAIGRMR
ncbi:MAG: ATP-binding cassette domain-containing protein [Dehalococcoidia bacterium]|nr:ATP-binding cassette domain-containing protein [Dehalococcoidia bacterium]